MPRKIAVVGMMLAFLLLFSQDLAFATATPPYVFVNHATKECAVRYHGDDCSWCEPPEGWQELGEEGRVQCPAGYARVENLQFNCKRYKSQFCCTSRSHHGDCEDMVVNDSQQQCAFVEDIAGCALPAGWAGRPANVREQDWMCPYYDWGNTVACMAALTPLNSTLTPTPEPSLTFTPEPSLTFTPKPTLTPTPKPSLTFTPQPILAPMPEPTHTSTPAPPSGINGLGCLGPAVVLGMLLGLAAVVNRIS